MRTIRKAIDHFTGFHRGSVNIFAHVIGFAGLFYSIYKLDWTLFAVFLALLEFGHVYNHFAGIKQYDFQPKVIFWRLIIFIVVVLVFFLISHSFPKP